MKSRLMTCVSPMSLAAGMTLVCTAAHAQSSVQPIDQTGANAPPSTKKTQAGSHAQGTSDSTFDDEGGEHVKVVGHTMNILNEPIGIGRMPQDVMHTPQTVNVVPKLLLEQQNVKSLDEALRNVPGITASVGEGEGGMAGDQFLIRGFQAQNDIYEDGLRDFGVYARDSFDYDRVSVIKGPSSEIFGNGTTGGAINITTKVAHLGDSYNANFSGGSGQYYRGTLDFNKQIGDGIAIRIAGMGNENNVVGRNNIFSHHWGIAPSIGFGLGKKTTFTLEYFHQTDNRIPDYGVPVITRPGTKIGRPATEYGLNRNSWYGTTYDQDDSDVDMLTGRLKSEINQYITLYDDLRGGMYSRYFSASQPGCDATCTANFFNNPSAAMINRRGHLGGPEPYQQDDWSVQNVFSGVGRFRTGGIRHEMIAGVDVEHVYDRRTNYAYNFNGQNGTKADMTSMINPSAVQPGLLLGGYGQYPNNLVRVAGVGNPLHKTGDATDVGAFFSEQMWLIPEFSIKAGFRWDHWNSHYSATEGAVAAPTRLSAQQDTFNPTVSLMYTPTRDTMVYFNWAEATTPMGLYVTNSTEPLRSSTAGFKPERSRLYEFGVKQQFFNQRVGVTAAAFRLEKGNAMITDPGTGTVTSSSDQQRNQGVELSASGEILKNWTVIATYAYYNSETTYSATVANRGKQLQYVPKNSATIWSTYTLAPKKPWNLMFGGGLTWREGVWLDQANTARVPANVDFSAVISHNITEHWRLALNGYNLANRLNYSNLFSDRATPAVGRTFMGSIALSY